MKKSADFDRPCGVLNIGMAIVTVTFLLFGFCGYLKWGEKTLGTLTLNVPEGDV